MTDRVRRVGWLAMTVFALAIALISTRYFAGDPAAFFEQQRLVFLAHQAPLYLHIGGGVLALALGPFQFVRRLRERLPLVHRLTGRVYVVAVLAAGVGGLLLAPRAFAGPVAASGFAAMAAVLLATTIVAFVNIRRGLVPRHRAWMTRSYAVIFSAVTFRLWIGGLPAAGLSFDAAYASGAWASWIINLLVAELVIRGRR